MADREPAYDPYIPSGPAHGGQTEETMARIKKEMAEAKAAMKDNIEATAERGTHIDTLQDKTNNLQNSAQRFRTGANRVRKQMWWKDMKMRICIIVGIIILLLVIIVPSVVASKNH